eukprot:TRINITY_DN28462_c0_g1_i1.p1 TRINITY_DN28462_c0_g1~~TRINITY_DN28462_c0_g1_i1.p1  ORF type:complete len:446 (+),score=165.47 TRINITY_DN28462_c0_g1_i1:51-1340(+)
MPANPAGFAPSPHLPAPVVYTVPDPAAGTEDTVRGVTVHAERLRLTEQVALLQQKLARVDYERGSHSRECARLELELRDRDARVDGALETRRRLEEELAELQAPRAAVQNQLVELGKELAVARREKREAQAELQQVREENRLLKEWLDRGVVECARVADELDKHREKERRSASPARPADVNTLRRELTVASKRNADSNRVLAPLSVGLREAASVLRWVEDALLRGSSDVLCKLEPLPPLSECSPVSPRGSPGAADELEGNPHTVRDAAVACYDAVCAVVATAAATLQRTVTPGGGADVAATLLRRATRAQQDALRAEARCRQAQQDARDADGRATAAEEEKDQWRARAESARMGSVAEHDAREAQTVAANLVRERDGLRARVAALRQESLDLRNAYSHSESAREDLADEVRRLRSHAAGGTLGAVHTSR